MSVCSQTGVWEQEKVFSLVPKLKFGNAMTMETPFPVTKQMNGTDTFPKRSFKCQCVPKPEFGNKKKYINNFKFSSKFIGGRSSYFLIE